MEEAWPRSIPEKLADGLATELWAPAVASHKICFKLYVKTKKKNVIYNSLPILKCGGISFFMLWFHLVILPVLG